jgi:tetratricopeptide (TPR) repeat protein
MGGFAALVFSDAVPNAEVLALNPQTTLDIRIVPWEKRWKIGQAQNWDGDFSDAAIFSRRARKIYVTYDPFYVPDRMHVERLSSDNLVRVQVPLVGHSTTIWLNKMGLLKSLFQEVLDGTYDARAFREAARKRRTLARYYIQLALQAGRRRRRLRDWSLQRAAELGESDPTAFLELAAMHMADHNVDAAEALLGKFIELKPNYPHGYYQMSQLMQKTKRIDQAIHFGKKALSANPKNITYQTWLERILPSAE